MCLSDGFFEFHAFSAGVVFQGLEHGSGDELLRSTQVGAFCARWETVELVGRIGVLIKQ